MAVIGGTAGWFFFYAIFALWIRRNDAYNTVTSIFYFFFLFVSSMFYPVDALPAALRVAAYANPVTWHTDILRFATVGLGHPGTAGVGGRGVLRVQRRVVRPGARGAQTPGVIRVDGLTAGGRPVGGRRSEVLQRRLADRRTR